MLEIFTVSELTACLKKHLEVHFNFIQVRGEISNFKEQASGHLYFTLKDHQSQISAVLFKGNAKSLLHIPKDGDQVVVKGELNIYAPRGSYQIIIRELEYVGLGELLLKFHELKIKLEKRGWFDKSHKKPLPKIPRTIGVITSPTGAVIQDILNVLNRRFSSYHLILNPVRVQGEGAAVEIAQAVEQFNQHRLVDVIILGRGGGSLEDLWAFNEEIVAAAIFASHIPIISAVGHETDFSLSDYVADVRAPTPSAAAEMVIAEKAHLHRSLFQINKRFNQTLSSQLREHRLLLERFSKSSLLSNPYTILGARYQMLDDLKNDFAQSIKNLLDQKTFHLHSLKKNHEILKPINQITSKRQKLTHFESSLRSLLLQKLKHYREQMNPLLLEKRLSRRMEETLQTKKDSLKWLVNHLKAIDPKNLLTKGYCILFPEKEDSAILSILDLTVNQPARLLMKDGEAIVKVTHLTQRKEGI